MDNIKIKKLKTMNFQLSKTNYDKPTPVLVRRIGDGILAASTILNIVATLSGVPPIFGVIANIAGVAGKYFSNFYSH
jgi:hypothetical protein